MAITVQIWDWPAVHNQLGVPNAARIPDVSSAFQAQCHTRLGIVGCDDVVTVQLVRWRHVSAHPQEEASSVPLDWHGHLYPGRVHCRAVIYPARRLWLRHRQLRTRQRTHHSGDFQHCGKLSSYCYRHVAVRVHLVCAYLHVARTQCQVVVEEKVRSAQLPAPS